MTIKKLKVLAIGNSFSEDAMEYVNLIAKDNGIDTLVLGNLFIPGASIQTHRGQIENKGNGYIYYKNIAGVWTSKPNSTLIDGLTDEEWDIITLQQVSHLSGISSTIDDNLTKIMDFVDNHKTNRNAKFYWHMTWAYQEDADHEGFVNYGRDQIIMYKSIINTVKEKILTNPRFSKVIPAGTTIQNLRTGYCGDTLTRDGYHLTLNIGRYAASVIWVCTLTGIDPMKLAVMPEWLDDKVAQQIKESVYQTLLNPFKITMLEEIHET